MTTDGCGSGHAVRGIALVEAAERYNARGAPNGVHTGPGDSRTREVPTLPKDGRASRVIGSAPLTLRAFGPPVRPNGPLPDLTGYEAFERGGWHSAVLEWQPDLLIGDLRADRLEILRLQLGVPAWLLMRIWPREWREPVGWRVFAIEPGVSPLMGIRESVPPIVGRQRVWPEDGAEISAGYGAWHEAVWYGYSERVRWVDGGAPERRLRIEAGGARAAENGADVLVRLTCRASGASRLLDHDRDRPRHASERLGLSID